MTSIIFVVDKSVENYVEFLLPCLFEFRMLGLREAAFQNAYGVSLIKQIFKV